MWEWVFAISLVLGALLYAQRMHYQYLERKGDIEKKVQADASMTEMWKEFQEYKKRVDVLTLKAGLKL